MEAPRVNAIAVMTRQRMTLGLGAMRQPPFSAFLQSVYPPKRFAACSGGNRNLVSIISIVGLLAEPWSFQHFQVYSARRRPLTS
jgi:hypothetical protein